MHEYDEEDYVEVNLCLRKVVIKVRLVGRDNARAKAVVISVVVVSWRGS